MLLMRTQSLSHASSNHSRKSHGNSITNLPHAFSPRAGKRIPVGKGLESGTFAHRKISDPAICVSEHIFPARNTVVTRLQSLCREIETAACMSVILPCASLIFVISNAQSFGGFWVR